MIFQQIIVGLAVLIPILVIVFAFKSIIKHETGRILFVYFILIFIDAVLNSSLALLGVNNMIVFNLFTILEFIVLSYYFMVLFENRSKLVYISVVIIAVLLILELFFLCNDSFNNLSAVITNIIFILACIYFYIMLFREEKVHNLLNYPDFYFVSGLLISFAGGLFVIAFANYALSISIETAKTLWHFYAVLNLISYFVVSIGFYKCRMVTK